MDPAHRAVLRKLRAELCSQLLVSESILPVLFQEGVLTHAHVEDIESEPTDTRKSQKLLDILPNRGPGAFPAFMRSLADFSWIRDRLLHELQAEPEPRTAGSCHLSDSVLQRVLSDQELCRLSFRIGAEWEVVLKDLGLSAEAVFRCRSDHSLSTQAAALSGLVLWRRSGGRSATARRLLESLTAAGVHESVLEEVLARPNS
ncbi:Death domain-containing protein CRADD [Oryzias melastigma]|uniref:Death domain-containing protein CRADD n=1 Tax=Oryzias melastigma TaxID=30732 RepID=A0A834L1R3_ORYME|nr:death domain-containing protein CRADD isoform X1 [Oryzias melastigma]KAF6738417.1 Death domain-containing protein CRADD [Oryzias melastigma]